MLRNLTFNTIYLAPKKNVMRIQSQVKFLFFLFTILLFLSFSIDPVQKKVIRTKDYDIHFYVFLQKKITTKDKEYFWYKAGEIHHSFGGAAGELLHLDYTKYYVGNKLAEKGEFEYGLKTGIWKQWHPNGAIMEESRWVDGVKFGPYSLYNDKGELVTIGKYRNNIKSDIWIDLKTNDTTWYKDGQPYKEHPRLVKKRLDSINGKKSLFNKLFGKKDTTAVKKEEGFFKRIFNKKKDDQNPKVRSPKKTITEEKPSFFQRIFGKKDENIKTIN